ncbi:MAG: hypothetical protein DRJ26_00730 [Candidatus Methanomethylicota archaeon]|uniref:Uncharacterized protein n=1 Tax=Thermoproteota archaeon TaxID=2056631 RepID=A0A497F7W4_9CREN|nr:MAG: hypothetical protein DRJ26_00730 [Candidatus Verstraetearchaeota archaeon]
MAINARELVKRAFESAAPYLSKPSYIKTLIEDIILKNASIEDLIHTIEKLSLEEKEIQIRTDFRIFLNALKRELGKKGEHYGSEI